MRKLIAAVTMLLAVSASAQQAPILVDPNTGRFMGNMNRNHMDPNSIYNPLGVHGNPLNPNSVNSYTQRYNQWMNNPYRSPQPPSPTFNGFSH